MTFLSEVVGGKTPRTGPLSRLSSLATGVDIGPRRGITKYYTLTLRSPEQFRV